MNFDLSDEQKMLAEQARGLLAERSPPARLRQLIGEGAEIDAPLWRELGEMGFLGAAIAEAHGGLGLSALDLGVISQELGRANACLPFFSSVVLAGGALSGFGNEAHRAAWLPGIASGETIGTFAYAEGPADWRAALPATTFADSRVTGTKSPVADGGVADFAVVLVVHQGAQALALVDLRQPEVTRTALESFDQLRAHHTIHFAGAKAELLTADAGALAQLLDQAAGQAAFEAVGGAQACLAMARDYAMDRQIFGRPLASYQAIKHRLADIAVAVELALSNAYYAGWAARNAPAELPAAAAAARLTAMAAFESAARENIQVHGGIGYTFEANCHFYYRRERTLALSLGGREIWADRLIDHTA